MVECGRLCTAGQACCGWCQEELERVRQRNQKYYGENREEILAKTQEYRQENREAILAQEQEYY